MKKFLASYDISGIGHNEESFVVEAETLEQAKRMAKDAALERAEESIVCDAVELTDEVSAITVPTLEDVNKEAMGF